MTTYPKSVARLVNPNGPELKKKDDPRVKAVRRRLQARNKRYALQKR